MLARLLLTCGLLAALPAASPASFVVYTNLASFQAATTGLTTETFNGGPTGSAPLVVNGITVSDPRNPSNNVSVNFAFYGSGNAVQLSTTSPGGTVLTLTLPSAVTAVGFDIFDLGTVGSTTLSASLSNGDTGPLVSGFTGGTGNTLFRGLTSTTPFTSITLSNTAAGDFIEFDNLRFGAAATNAVPAPAGLVLAGLGAPALGLFRLRRRLA